MKDDPDMDIKEHRKRFKYIIKLQIIQYVF